MNLKKMLRSFQYAFQGILALIKYENNAKFHFLFATITLLLGIYLKISTTEWAIIITQIGLVFSAEAFNTAIEKLCDFVSPKHELLIGKVKDLAAGGVLLVAITAIVVGFIVFLPKIIFLMK